MDENPSAEIEGHPPSTDEYARLAVYNINDPVRRWQIGLLDTVPEKIA